MTLQQFAVSCSVGGTCWFQCVQNCTEAAGMLSHTFFNSSEPRCSYVNKSEMSSQRRENETLQSKNHKDAFKSRQPHFHTDLNCPVCLQTATLPVETNCGHLFCGSCLMEYWKHDPWLGAINCPLCRQKVVLLYKEFSEIHQDVECRNIVQDIRLYNNRFSGKPRPLTDYLYDLPSLLQLVLRRLFTMGGLVWIFCLRVVVCLFGAIMCLSSPFDVIRDPLCGILSTIDDLVVVFILLICMINILQQLRSEGLNMASSTTQSVLSES
ncbi:E3 ubiquitin- ligase RNF170-like isoform X1 [Pelobates cultripes]|uniref:E3 ubiquitin- ligase RNF170-like isoform X1 n=2 Tax=Pelobates cultripes TaxID=61616 RepID=A0AAD1SXS1_PELCU|nr:E3 ubiquitin- ligase RNF170-like isoform X1 [Pelobates cultripes]